MKVITKGRIKTHFRYKESERQDEIELTAVVSNYSLREITKCNIGYFFEGR
ncbi:hypothetical protein HORM4_1060040 [Vibrio harveyi]|nr:hypothetical protein HORM4_1060040 [Vibrio harveyi]